MSQLFKIVCRGSRLSLAQADIMRKRLQQFDRTIEVGIIIKETRGDMNHGSSLAEMEGKDFFTKDIQDFLLTGQADFAVHSLKDVSGEDFFKNNHFAIIEREDPRDVAIFNPNIKNKLLRGEKLVLGTSSPRRTEMATGFLSRALPRFIENKPILEAAPIRGNVDTRLQKLSAGEYDGIILACAGLNRLLNTDAAREEVAGLLGGKRLMILPLLDCPPAPGQGAIVAECARENERAVNVLKQINDVILSRAVDLERKIAHQYGSGCHQKFGIVHIDTGDQRFIRAAGVDRKGNDFCENYSEAGLPFQVRKKLSPVDSADPLLIQHHIRLISNNYSLVESPLERIWVEETETWFALAKKGVWVEGSLEGFGLKFNAITITSPLVNSSKLNQVLG